MAGMSGDMGGAPQISWPVAAARLVDSLDATQPGQSDWVAEPSWDGYRVVWAGGQFYGRRGQDLTGSFPDLASELRVRLPPSAVVDGELLCWDTPTGRPDFAGLQARLSAGAGMSAVVASRPAQLVAFDLLHEGDHDLRPRPLSERRRRLAELLSGLASGKSAPIVLCQQTCDAGQAQEWLAESAANGIESLVVKNDGEPYPTQSGQRIWRKVRVRPVRHMVAVGVTGELPEPTRLVLSTPFGSGPAVAGITTQLPGDTARALGPLLRPTGRTVDLALLDKTTTPADVQVIMPLVIEISTDVAIEDGRLQQPARLLRARPDLTVPDVLDLD